MRSVPLKLISHNSHIPSMHRNSTCWSTRWNGAYPMCSMSQSTARNQTSPRLEYAHHSSGWRRCFDPAACRSVQAPSPSLPGTCSRYQTAKTARTSLQLYLQELITHTWQCGRGCLSERSAHPITGLDTLQSTHDHWVASPAIKRIRRIRQSTLGGAHSIYTCMRL